MHANETHGVPHLHESLVPEALLAKIDRLTAIDRKIYAWARQRLIPKLCALRLSSNVLGEDAQACMLPTEQRGPVPLHLLLISDQGRQEETAARWQQANPGLQVTAMDMCDGAKYLSESPFWGEQYASAFRRIRYAAIKSDLVRIAFLAEHGGFYVDSDHVPGNLSLIELVRTVQDAKKNLVLPLVPEKELVKGEQVRVYNALLGAVPRHPGMIHLVVEALNNVHKEVGGCTSLSGLSQAAQLVATRLAVTDIAGPRLLGRMLRHLPDVYWLEKSKSARGIAVVDRSSDAGVREVSVGVTYEEALRGAHNKLNWWCTNEHWTDAVKTDSVYWPDQGHPGVTECEGAATRGPSAILVTHHKTGTVASFSVLAEACCPSAREAATTIAFWKAWNKCKVECASQGVFLAPGGLQPLTSRGTWRNYKWYTDSLRAELCASLMRPTIPVIHFVRSPEAMVVSGHFYHQSCPEGWTENHFDASDPITKRFGNASGFAQLLAVMGESTESWNLGQMTWCRVLKMKSDEQGVRAEALRNILALDGVRTMLEDRRRLRQRTLDLGSQYHEVCNEALSSRNTSAPAAWARLGSALSLSVRPQKGLEQSHASRASDNDRARLARIAAVSLRGLLSAELLAEYPPC